MTSEVPGPSRLRLTQNDARMGCGWAVSAEILKLKNMSLKVFEPEIRVVAVDHCSKKEIEKTDSKSENMTHRCSQKYHQSAHGRCVVQTKES